MGLAFNLPRNMCHDTAAAPWRHAIIGLNGQVQLGRSKVNRLFFCKNDNSYNLNKLHSGPRVVKKYPTLCKIWTVAQLRGLK